MDVENEPLISKINWSKYDERTVNADLLNSLIDRYGNRLLFTSDEDGFYPIHWTAILGYEKAVKVLIERGTPVDLEARNEVKTQAIHLAAMEGRIGVINVLRDFGADINAIDKSHCTPIMRAAMFGFCDEYRGAETVLHLISLGANPFIIDDIGLNCLHLATLHGNEETACLLLTIGLDANSTTNAGLKPFHIALYSGNYPMMRLLQPLTLETQNNKYIRRLKYYERKTFKQIIDDGFTVLSKTFVLIAVLVSILWIYPQYAFIYFPATKDLWFYHCVLIVFTWSVWFSWYRTMFCDPGYLPRDSEQYFEILSRKLKPKYKDLKIFEFVKLTDDEDEIKLCHTCRTFQPRRAKHCRFCERCTTRFDHHCVYLGTCIGERNRLAFFTLIFTLTTSGILLFILIMITISREDWNWSTYHLTNISYCAKVVSVGGLLTICTIRRAAINLTQNEEIKRWRYRYLRDKEGRFRNPFDRGSYMKNLFEFFGFDDLATTIR